MVDATRRKLQMPPWHTPYLEKHRIYELFHELARELVVQQPIDHVLFLKQILKSAANSRDVARVVLLSSPKVNFMEIARQICEHTRQLLICEQSILGCFNKPKDRDKISPQRVAACLAHLARKGNAYNTGWVMAGCIRTAKEATAMLQEGILPTHVFHLIPPFDPPLCELLYCHVKEGWPEYRRNITAIRDVFKKNLTEIHLKQVTLQEIISKILDLMRTKRSLAPMKPRVVIIGPRGSGRRTQAEMLVQHLGLVLIDFEYLLCQVWISNTELGQRLRDCKSEACFHSELLSRVINRRILEKDCLENGYVLINYPNTVTDFRYLDALDTPPNRVVILDCDLGVCKERITSRRIDAHTGSVVDVSEGEVLKGRLLKLHPKDAPAMVEAEFSFYCEQYGSLRTYCGATAHVVNSDQPLRWVHETICSIIVRAETNAVPRNPYAEQPPAPSAYDFTSTDSSCACGSPSFADPFDIYV